MEHELLALVRPLVVGANAPGGFRLEHAYPMGPGRYHYYFRPLAARCDPVLVTVDRRELKRPGFRDTLHFTVGYQSAGDHVPRAAMELLEFVAARVAANEESPTGSPGTVDGDPALPVAPPVVLNPATSPLAAPALYLVPGHLGNPKDISLRGFGVLAGVHNIFLEEGTLEVARVVLQELDLDPASKRWIELPDKDLGRGEPEAVELFRELVGRGEAACLFGGCEGTPAFNDPGSGLVREADRLGVPVRSVGGPSALNMALMRVEENLGGGFLFLGRLESGAHVDVIVDRVHSAPRSGPLGELPFVVFAFGRECRSRLPDLLGRIEWSKAWILAELTTDRETVYPLLPPRPAGFDALADGAPVVVIVFRPAPANPA